MKILVVEDEKRIVSFIKKGLKYEGYTVDAVLDGSEAREIGMDQNYDLIILDVMLPGIDGITLCKYWRENKIQTPIIMLTAKDSVDDRVIGLDAGADDYLIKPFAFKELLARIRSLLRRDSGEKKTVLMAGDLTLDPATREVIRQGKRIDLSRKEYALLEYLMRNKGKVLTRTMIAEHVWDYDFDSFTNTIDVYVRYLRKKVDDDYGVKLIQTVRGVGYKIDEDVINQ